MHHPEDYSRKELEQATAHLSNGQKQLLACHIMRNMIFPSGRKPWDILDAENRFSIASVERHNRGQGANFYRESILYDLGRREREYSVKSFVLHAVLIVADNAHLAWPWYCNNPPTVENPATSEAATRASLNCVVGTAQMLAWAAATEATGVHSYGKAIERRTQRYWAAIYDAGIQTVVYMAENFRETAVQPVFTPPYAPGMRLICVKDVSFGNNMSPCNPAIYTTEHTVKEGDLLTVVTADFFKHSWWLLTFNEFPGGWCADGAFVNSFIPERTP
jgi:hypothetical protein